MRIGWQDGTVIGGWAVAIARALDQYDLDSEALFSSCRLNLTQALDSNARFPVTRISQVLAKGVEASGDDSLGLVVAKYIRPTSWHALGISIWASDCMAESCERLVRYRRMFHTALDIRLVPQAEHWTLEVAFAEALEPLLNEIDMDAIMATIVLTCRHLAEGRFLPLGVNLRRPPPAKPADFSRLFRCDVNFCCPSNQILIARKDMEAPLPTRNAELALLNDRLIQEYLTRLDRDDIVNQVYVKLMQILGREAPDQQRLARALNLSQRNLQRRLQLAGTSYQEILDQLRRELALKYLQQSHLSINAISYHLGFSKVGSFTRAFRSWTSQSPSEYRRTQLEGGARPAR